MTDAILYLRENQLQQMEPTREREDAWVAHHDEVASMTLMMQTNSWYTGANIEGKPRRLLSYIGGVGEYRAICDEVRESGYQGFALG